MSDLLSLAERCEKASGPDRELDRLIFATVKPGAFADAAEAAQYADPSYEGNNADWYYLSTIDMPRYSRSIEAALTLRLAGMRAVIVTGGDYSSCEIIAGWSRPRFIVPTIERADDQIALCVVPAWLRARAAVKEGE